MLLRFYTIVISYYSYYHSCLFIQSNVNEGVIKVKSRNQVKYLTTKYGQKTKQSVIKIYSGFISQLGPAHFRFFPHSDDVQLGMRFVVKDQAQETVAGLTITWYGPPLLEFKWIRKLKSNSLPSVWNRNDERTIKVR